MEERLPWDTDLLCGLFFAKEDLGGAARSSQDTRGWAVCQEVAHVLALRAPVVVAMGDISHVERLSAACLRSGLWQGSLRLQGTARAI